MTKRGWWGWMAGIAATVWAAQGMVPSLGAKGQDMANALFWGERGLLRPQWDLMPTVASGLTESLQIAVVGTAMAGAFALLFGMLAASNFSPGPISLTAKALLNGIRTLPELLMAIIFIVGVGPGPFAGVLALGFHSIGTLGKLTAEILESLDTRPMEAVVAVGGGRLSVFRYAAWPQVLPEFFSVLLYRFEINIRAASILGMVGAGGIGKTLMFAINARSWDRVGAILVGIVVVVAVVDTLSARLRAKLV